MDALPTPISTKYLKPFSRPEPIESRTPINVSRQPSSPQDALNILKSEPEYDQLIAALRYISSQSNINGPSPENAKIVQTLVANIAPHFWALFAKDRTRDYDSESPLTDGRDDHLYLSCLLNLAGLNTILTSIRALIDEARHGGLETKRAAIASRIGIFLDILDRLLIGHNVLFRLWTSGVKLLPDQKARRPVLVEVLALFTSGQLVSVAAEADAVCTRSLVDSATESLWLADGSEYSKWLGKNICSWMSLAPTHEDRQLGSTILSRSLRFGNFNSLMSAIIDQLLLTKGSEAALFVTLLHPMPIIDQKKVIFWLLQYLSARFLASGNAQNMPDSKMIGLVGGVIGKVVDGCQARIDHLVSWCSSTSGAGLGESVGIRRAVIAVLSRHADPIFDVLQRCLKQFGDALYIMHAPIMQQEVHAQVLLLSAGGVNRLTPSRLHALVRTSGYLSTISNRLGSTQDRTRLLGLIIGEALSFLVDGKEKQLHFGLRETQTEEVQWYKGLPAISDQVETFETLQLELSISQPTGRVEQSTLKPSKETRSLMSRSLSKWITSEGTIKRKPIIEVIDHGIDDNQENEHYKPYSTPADDPEDSDDDPTLIQRFKPQPPVYIRDLLVYFRDTGSYDKQLLALMNAPIIIRRKSGFGTEVSDHAMELASVLVCLGDHFELEDFASLRQDAMTALIIACPAEMAPWFGKTFFEGDYSISQRAAVLNSVGTAAREIAGLEVSEHALAAAFPSQRLPKSMDKLYMEPSEVHSPSAATALKPLPSRSMHNAAISLASSFVGPLAASGADALAGSDALKLSTFNSRTQAGGQAATTLIRIIPNTTASLLATSFFFPLTARFLYALQSPAAMRLGIVAEPSLLALFVKTLAVVVHAAGPSTLALSRMTAELWDLLLNTRRLCVGDLTVTHAVLIGFVVLLEVNAEGSTGNRRHFCQVHGREIIESRAWVAEVFEGIRGGAGEEAEVKALAATILVKLGEAVAAHRVLLLGNMIDC